MPKTLHKNLIIMLLIITVLFSVVFPIVGYAQSNIAFDNIPVMDDLLTSKDFNASHYGFNEKGRLKILNFVEYCYSPFSAERNNFGLYIYIFNETNIKFINAGNSIQIAPVSADGIVGDYKKYPLKLLSSSTGDVANMFHKFKVMEVDSLIEKVNSNTRKYNVSGMELNTYNGAKDHTIGGQYTFTGFAKGYGPDNNAESTLKSSVKDIVTIQLDVMSSFYRIPGNSSLGTGHQDNLSSVYFAIDNKIIEEYGKLHAVDIEWYEYKTSPIVVINDETFYNELNKKVGVKISNIASLDNSRMSLYAAPSSGDGSPGYTWGWNAYSTTSYPYNNPCSLLTNLFYTTTDFKDDSAFRKFNLSGEKLLDYWRKYDKSYITGKTPTTRAYSFDLFENKADEGRTVGYNRNYIDNSKTWNLENSTIKDNWWSKLFNISENTSIAEIKPIHAVTDTDRNANDLSTLLLIDKNDVGEFRTYYDSAKLSNKTTYLFRYAVTDYYATRLYADMANDSKLASNKNAIMSQQTAFLDLDIIEVKFNKDGVYTRIPVVADPIDVISDITPPWEAHGKNSIAKWLIILASIIFILWLLNITGVLPYVMKAIGAPFRFVGNLFKKNKGGSNNVTIYTSGEIKANENTKKKAKERLKHDKTKKD